MHLRTSSLRFTFAAVAAAAAALPTPAPTAPKHKITSLPPLSGFTHSGAYGIGPGSAVVGESFNRSEAGTDTAFRPTRWDGTTATDLGTLPGHDAGIALSMNASGTIVGYSAIVESDREAVQWRKGQITSLGRLSEGGRSQAAWVSDQGRAVGRAENAERQWRAVLYRGGEVTDLGTLPGTTHSAAQSINNRGVIAGRCWVPDENGGELSASAFLWRSGRMEELPGLPGATHTRAWELNDDGIVVGESTDSTGASHAVRWDKGRITDLGIPIGADYSVAWTVNQLGEIAGDVGPADQLRPRLAVWRGKVGTPLGFTRPPAEGWTWLSAADMDEKGRIVGQGLENGVERGFRFTTR